MVTYSRDEMVGVTELGKSLGKYLDKIVSNAKNRFAIIRRNEPEAVIVSIQEYERLKEVYDYFEDKEIAQIIKNRLENKKEINYITEDELKKRLKKAGKNVL